MEGKRFLQKIKLQNLLSFGSEGVELELQPLNVLIGPNGSGKSNLIEAISVLRATPRNLQTPFREGGGFAEWIWKGTKEGRLSGLSAWLPPFRGDVPLLYTLTLALASHRARVDGEILIAEQPDKAEYYIYSSGFGPVIRTRLEGLTPVMRDVAGEEFNLEQSVFSQFKDPDAYPELTEIGRRFERIETFRDWDLSRNGALRQPQRVDLPDDFLLDDASNLGLILNDLQNRRAVWKDLLKRLRLLYQGVEDLTLKVQGGTVQILFHEEGLGPPVPAARLSDGTLRYLCLLAVLLHPEPPPLICIEEPELGLHPDAVRAVGDLLIEASQRTQLIVTTHSDALVSALSEVPEAIVVCERGESGTTLRRLEPEKLKPWLERYSLGDLWVKGEIGGNRW